MVTQFDGPVIALIEEHVRQLLRAMGIEDAAVRCTASPEDAALRISVEAGEKGKALIGHQGAHLGALQHVVRCLLRKKLARNTYITVDVNGYRLRRERSLLGLAEEVARKAHRTGRTVVLRPMAASDRKMIHSALANHKGIQTESLGDEPNRRVVVRPIFL